MFKIYRLIEKRRSFQTNNIHREDAKIAKSKRKRILFSHFLLRLCVLRAFAVNHSRAC